VDSGVDLARIGGTFENLSPNLFAVDILLLGRDSDADRRYRSEIDRIDYSETIDQLSRLRVRPRVLDHFRFLDSNLLRNLRSAIFGRIVIVSYFETRYQTQFLALLLPFVFDR